MVRNPFEKLDPRSLRIVEKVREKSRSVAFRCGPRRARTAAATGWRFGSSNHLINNASKVSWRAVIILITVGKIHV